MTFQNKKLNSANPMKLDLSRAVMGATPPAAPASAGDLARSGAAKRLTDAQPGVGQKRQTSGEMHPYQHGQTVQDESDKTPSHEKTIPVHPGMTDAQKSVVSASAGSILTDAANLGRKA
jgi:hypothetical protein